MAAINEPAGQLTTGDDISALSWVHDELRRSLELANKALRRFLKEREQTSDLDTVDPAVLRQARSQLHQSVGVLELVGLGPAAQVLRAAEAALQRLSNRPKLITTASVDTLEQGSFALLDFIGRRLAGKPVSTLSLFPQYRALQELAGASRVHPADLWTVPWSWRELPLDASVVPRQADTSTVNRIEADLLALMRGAGPAVSARMSDVFAGLAAFAHQEAGASQAAGAVGMNAPHKRLATLWQLAAGFYEAQADGLLAQDTFIKRVGSKLLAQLRAGAEADPSERLAHDLLFFCGQATAHEGLSAGPRLAAVQTGYGLQADASVDYQHSALGRFDPAWVAQAHKRVAAAKEVWSAVAGGDLARLPGLTEQFSLVGDSLSRLFAAGEVLGRSLLGAASQVASSGEEPASDLAMEVATSLLYLDASIDDGDFDHPDGATRIARLARRVDAVRQGRDPGTLELWMEELYRRVSDRQTMGSVVQELRASLSEVEKHIDQYFRDPAKREVLIPVPAQLSAMRGVLSVLGLDQASQAVLRMRDDVDALASTEVHPQHAIEAGTFDRLADNLGALSFLIDMVSVQPQMAKSLFRFDPDTGSLSSVMAREDRPTGFDDLDTRPQAETNASSVTLEFDRIVARAQAQQPAVLASSTTGAGTAGMPALSSRGLPIMSFDDPVEATQRPSPESAASASVAASEVDATPLRTPPATVAVSGLEDDPEMREVFLEEAGEVLQGARDAMSQLATAPGDLAAMTNARRAFHTLKGSSRMVGLMAFGEAAWSCEQLYNARIADQAGADAALLSFSAHAFDFFDRWVQALTAGDASAFSSDELSRQADSLRTVTTSLPEVAVLSVPTPVRIDSDDLVGDNLPALVSIDMPNPANDAPDFEAIDLPLVTDDSALVDLQLKVPGLPSASDLDLDLPLLDMPPSKAEPEAPEVDLPALDLAALDEGVQTTAAAEVTELIADEWRAEDVKDLQALDAMGDLPEITAPATAVVATADELAVDVAQATAQATEVPEQPPVVSETAELVTDGSGAAPDAEAYRQIGPLRISIPLFNIYLNEADELSRRLGVELAEWSLEQQRAVGDSAVALAHSLAGTSGTVGYAGLSQLARELEHALGRSQARGHGFADEAALFIEAADEIRRLLHLFAAGFLNEPVPSLLQRLHDLAHAAPEPVTEESPNEDAPELAALGRAALLPFTALADAAPRAPSAADSIDIRGNLGDDIDQVDAVDAELFPIFEEEALELLPQLQSRLRDWSHRPGDPAAASACMRCLHTLKGSARLAGAMRLGEMAHRLETLVERLASQGGAARVQDVDALVAHADSLEMGFLGLQQPATSDVEVKVDLAKAKLATPARPAVNVDAVVIDQPVLPVVSKTPVSSSLVPAAVSADAARPAAAASPVLAPVAQVVVDWKRFAAPTSDVAQQASAAAGAAAGSVRVRTSLLDRLVNHAGEVSISRSRIESDVVQLKGGMGDLSDNLERLRSQLRDIELQAETQIGTRMEAARAAAAQFDPLEMDRFTRFQELTRMMAESVADVATWQRGLQRTLQSAEDALAHQARMTRDMQDDLLRTRMVEFEGLSERLYRVVRQAAKETGKSVRLDIVGGSIEVDRGVLDRMTAAFEHLLRNSVVHGIEAPKQREAAGKDATGTVTVAVTQVGNEVGVEVRDDGAGLDLIRIRDRARSMGLVQTDAEPSEAELANLIFQPGVTTATSVTDLAGRGVGMDVVRTDVNAMGGRIETASAPGQGTSFRLLLPLTTAVTQVVMLRCGERAFAVPATLVEIVRRVPLNDLARAYDTGTFGEGAQAMPFFWLDALLEGSARGLATGRTAPVVVIRSAAQRVVLHVDEVMGNQEVVVKNLGPQLSRVPGLVGMTLLPSGLPALIYNPVALATLYGEQARAATRAALAMAQGHGTERIEAESSPAAPLVLVVDDSLTVRRVTQRLLEREGYRVTVAKDGLDGLEKLGMERPVVLLTDIEMPRMDGFDLVRNLRTDERLAKLPVIMITSRIAQKHRDYAAELGVDHYLGKPYAEDELLGLVARYARRAVPA